MHAPLLLAASVLATVASAQTAAGSSGTVASTTVSQAMPAAATQGFNSGEVTSATKASWCTSELNTCPMICGGVASVNTCDPTQLTYSCICSNGTQPDATAYMGTLPFFICQANFQQCIANHPNDLDGQTTCTNNEKCGTLNATLNTAATSSAASSSAAATSSSSKTGSASSTATATSSSSSSSSKSGAISNMNLEITTGAFAGLLFAACKFLL